jgi:hypothetical protein
MAMLLKDRARKPILEIASAFSKTKTENGELCYGIEICEPWRAAGLQASYTALLTRIEATNIMSKWLEIMAQQDIAAKKREKSA